jgi:hypothetical protein
MVPDFNLRYDYKRLAQHFTQIEQWMLEQLRVPAIPKVPEDQTVQRTAFQFVLEFGWFYSPSPLPENLDLGPDGECFNNALRLVLADDSLTYVEGFAAGGGSPPIPHAWVTDGKGRAIDNSWRLSGSVYAGVPFKGGVVSLIGLKNKGIGSVIEHFIGNVPLLDAMATDPEKWLDLRGNGSKKLT